jgi:hypothetical protein
MGDLVGIERSGRSELGQTSAIDPYSPLIDWLQPPVRTSDRRSRFDQRVVDPAQRDEVPEIRRAALLPRHDVVRVAVPDRRGAPRKRTPAIPKPQRVTQV